MEQEFQTRNARDSFELQRVHRLGQMQDFSHIATAKTFKAKPGDFEGEGFQRFVICAKGIV